jgi:hypothetical protein
LKTQIKTPAGALTPLCLPERRVHERKSSIACSQARDFVRIHVRREGLTLSLWLRASQSIPLNIVEGNGKNDFDPDSDFDLDKEQPQPSVPGDA